VKLNVIIFLFTVFATMSNARAFGILDQISQSSSVSDLITENILAISPQGEFLF